MFVLKNGRWGGGGAIEKGKGGGRGRGKERGEWGREGRVCNQ